METGLKDKNGTPIEIGSRTRLVLPNGEVREFDVQFKTVTRTVKNHPDFDGETSKVNITGVVFHWEGYDLFPCVDENGVSDAEKMEVIQRPGEKAKKTLGEVQLGKAVNIGGIIWNVLAHNENGGTLCVAADIVEHKPFDRENNNNWAESSLREELNSAFLEALCEEMKAQGLDPEAIMEHEQDLTADDGLKDYGTSKDKVFLLTEEQYRQYRQYMKKLEDWWWLITADSPVNHYARKVYTDGTLYSRNAYYGRYGVRPACEFSSSILINEE